MTNKLRQRLASMLIGGSLALGLAAPAGAEELRIGFIAPVTGIFAQIGKDMVDGFQLYLAEHNNKLGGMDVSDAKRLKALEKENARLKKLLAESMLENEVTREALRKSTDRTGSAGAGAVDDHEEVVGAAQPAGDRDERKRPALPATGRSNRRTEGANHRPGTAASPLRRGDDLPEAAAGRAVG